MAWPNARSLYSSVAKTGSGPQVVERQTKSVRAKNIQWKGNNECLKRRKVSSTYNMHCGSHPPVISARSGKNAPHKKWPASVFIVMCAKNPLKRLARWPLATGMYCSKKSDSHTVLIKWDNKRCLYPTN